MSIDPLRELLNESFLKDDFIVLSLSADTEAYLLKISKLIYYV